MTTRILLVDDHESVRQGARACLEREEDFQVVGEVGNGLKVVPAVQELLPDVVVLDHTLPGLNGLEVAQKVIHAQPDSKIVMFSMHTEDAYVARAVFCGILGYVTKDASMEELVTAIRCARRGEPYLSAPHDKESLKRYTELAKAGKFSPYETLTAREREVVLLVVEGLSSKAIGERLFISERTVESHRRRIRDKLGAKSTAEVVAIVLRYLAGLEES